MSELELQKELEHVRGLLAETLGELERKDAEIVALRFRLLKQVHDETPKQEETHGQQTVV